MGLPEKEVEQYDELGYVVKEGVYSYDDLEPLRAGLTGAIQEKCDELISAGTLDRDFSESSFETRLTELHRHDADAAHEVLMAIWSGRFHGLGILTALRHCHLIDCIEDLIGPEIVATSIYRIRAKVPGYLRGEVPWHQDAGYSLPHCYAHKMVTCWVPLVDATLDNGCLWVIPNVQEGGIIRHYTGGHAGFLEIAPEEVPEGAVPVEMEAGSVLFMPAMTPHASFVNKTDVTRWSMDLRYQDPSVPSNIGEVPEDYTPERDPVTMACFPGEAYFVVRDPSHPERELTDPDEFARLRKLWDKATLDYRGPGRGWIPLEERERPVGSER